MLSTTEPSLLLALGALGMSYWIALVAGGGLLLIAAASGGDSDAGLEIDADLDVDLDLDLAADADLDLDVDDVGAEGGQWAPDLAHPSDTTATTTAGGPSLADWLSLRFWIFFAAVYGAVGALLHHLTDLGAGLTCGLAVVSGLIAGQTVQYALRVIRANSGNSATGAGDYVNRLARVTIAIADQRKGEIVVQVRGGQRYIPAVAPPHQSFTLGDEVLVVGYRAGIAQVTAPNTGD